MAETTPIVNIDSVATRLGGNGSKFVHQSARLGPQIGLRDLGCSIYVVPPGKIAFPYHAHSMLEELCVVLEGTGTLRHEGVEHPIKAGDVIASPCGAAHQIINSSAANLKYLVVSSNAIADVVLYPDSSRIGAISGAFGKSVWHFTKTSLATGYYDGEE